MKPWLAINLTTQASIEAHVGTHPRYMDTWVDILVSGHYISFAGKRYMQYWHVSEANAGLARMNNSAVTGFSQQALLRGPQSTTIERNFFERFRSRYQGFLQGNTRQLLVHLNPTPQTLLLRSTRHTIYSLFQCRSQILIDLLPK